MPTTGWVPETRTICCKFDQKDRKGKTCNGNENGVPCRYSGASHTAALRAVFNSGAAVIWVRDDIHHSVLGQRRGDGLVWIHLPDPRQRCAAQVAKEVLLMSSLRENQ